MHDPLAMTSGDGSAGDDPVGDGPFALQHYRGRIHAYYCEPWRMDNPLI